MQCHAWMTRDWSDARCLTLKNLNLMSKITFLIYCCVFSMEEEKAKILV